MFTEEEQRQLAEEGEALLFSHSLENLIGGQLAAGLTLCGFYEDGYGEEDLAVTAHADVHRDPRREGAVEDWIGATPL